MPSLVGLIAARALPLRSANRPWVVRWARWLVLGVLIAMAASHLRWMIADWNLHDARYYYDAAVHLRHGEDLYVAGDPRSTFRYPPWFAAAWIPLTLLPKEAAIVVWSVGMLAASAWTIWPLIRQGTPAALMAALLFGELLFAISSIGNVQPLMVGVLLWGIPRRSGPIWIALAASLKVTPLAFALVYVARREWWRAGLAAGLTVALVAPMFLYEIPPNVFSVGSMAIMPIAVWLPLAIAAGGAAVVTALRRSAWTPLAAGVAAVLCLPRLLMYDVAMLLPGAIRFSPPSAERPGTHS
jgi:hypothetical protein